MEDEFNATWLDIFKNLSSDNIKEIKYLLDIPASEADDIKSHVHLFYLLHYMKRLGLLCKEKIKELAKLMESIGRHDLATQLGEAAQYREKWLDIFKGLSSDNIKEIKYLLDIPSSEAEDIKSHVDLLQYMKISELLCKEKIKELTKLMETIGRHDLATLLTGRNHAVQLQTEPNTYRELKASIPSEEDKAKQEAIRKKNVAKRNENIAVGIFFDRTSLLIGPFWNRLALSSGLDQHVVDAIDRNERTVQERALKLLDEMRQSGYLTWLSMKSVLSGLHKRQIIKILEELRDDLVLEYGNEMEFFNNALKDDVNSSSSGIQFHAECNDMTSERLSRDIGKLLQNLGDDITRELPLSEQTLPWYDDDTYLGVNEVKKLLENDVDISSSQLFNWRRFGRLINMSENFLNDIEDTYTYNYEKVYQCIASKKKKKDWKYWRDMLLDFEEGGEILDLIESKYESEINFNDIDNQVHISYDEEEELFIVAHNANIEENFQLLPWVLKEDKEEENKII